MCYDDADAGPVVLDGGGGECEAAAGGGGEAALQRCGCSFGDVGGRAHQHDELIAAEARGQITRTQYALLAFGDRLQELVAGFMAVLVVDGFEVVEVDEGDDQGLAGVG